MSDITHDGPDPEPKPSRNGRRVAVRVGAATIAIIVASAIAVQARDAPAVTSLQRVTGERAPAIQLPDLTQPDQTIELDALAGRPVVLNFWASWCVPCRREMPAFQALYERLGSQVAFLGINHQDSRDDALDLLRETGVQYPNGHDPQGRVAHDYGVFGMPTTVFISADGEILARRTGEIHADELERSIKEVLLNAHKDTAKP